MSNGPDDALRAKSAAAVRFMRRFMADVAPDEDSTVLMMAACQLKLSAVSEDLSGLLESAAQLVENMKGACGRVETLLFVRSGLGHAEFGVAHLLRRVASANPRFEGVRGFRTVICDDGGGPLPPFVLKRSVPEAIAAYGGESTAVICVNAGDALPQILAAAAAAACPFVAAWTVPGAPPSSPDYDITSRFKTQGFNGSPQRPRAWSCFALRC